LRLAGFISIVFPDGLDPTSSPPLFLTPFVHLGELEPKEATHAMGREAFRLGPTIDGFLGHP